MSYREQFELDKKSRHTDTMRRVDEQEDPESGRNQLKLDKKETQQKSGSFFDNLNWQAEEKESSDSDVEWDALRSENTCSEARDTATNTFDFFSESSPQRNSEANIDLFNPKLDSGGQFNHSGNSEDLLGFSRDSEGDVDTREEFSAPSSRPRKGTRHSSIGEEQLQSEFDLLNISGHCKEDSEADLLGLHTTANMKRNKSADDIFHISPTENKLSDDLFADFHLPSPKTPQSNATLDPFSGGKTSNIDIFNTTSAGGPILTPQVNTSWKQNSTPSQEPTKSDPFADLGGLGSSNNFGKISGSLPATNKPTPKVPPVQQQHGYQQSGKAGAKVQKPNYAPSYSTAGATVFGSYGLRDGYGKFLVALATR